MAKRQSIPIVILLLWFSYTFTLYTTPSFVELSADIITNIKNSEFFPGWLNGFFSVLLSNFDQYLSMALTGFVIGLIFSDQQQAFRVLLLIYMAFIMPSIFLLVLDFGQIQINIFIYSLSKIVVYVIDYLLLFFSMVLALKIFRFVFNAR